jgi:prolyl 4-hydroxylase
MTNNNGDGSLFIQATYIDENICKDLIEYFEKHPNQEPGKIYTSDILTVNTNVKNSTDVHITSLDCYDSAINNYLIELQNSLNDYISKFPVLQKHNQYTIGNGFNIQRYYPNEGYFQWHCERNSFQSSPRLLVFTTYLNTVNDGGETEFMYQNLKIKPETGLTVIFPADWMYYHRGIPSNTETKWIVTGWFSYVK